MTTQYVDTVARNVMSVRISPEVRDRLDREARQAGEPPASLAERLIDEGLRNGATR